jgi:dTDP-4-amino-4,6-dideoxygalactose transaminase
VTESATRTQRSSAEAATIPFARPDIGEAEISAVVETMRSGWISTGPKTKEFEKAFAHRVGASHAIGLNSATAGLHLALACIGVTAGDEVIVPSYTFAATAEVVFYMGARPVLVDVAADTLNIDPVAVEKAITDRTRAVIGVDIAGQPCEWDVLRELAKKRKLILIDDAAHALPSTFKSATIGTWADLTVFSFYATKPLTTGEGGMLVTNNQRWADLAEILSLHGISHEAWKRYLAGGTWRYEIVAAGFKYNMTDLAAAMGLVQLARLDSITERRLEIAKRYSEAFGRLPEVEVPVLRTERTSSWHLYILRLELDKLTCTRDDFIEQLRTRGIATSVHFIPLHLHPFYRESFGFKPEDFPVAHREYERAISLPIYSLMTDSNIARVIDAVSEVVSNNRR